MSDAWELLEPTRAEYVHLGTHSFPWQCILGFITISFFNFRHVFQVHSFNPQGAVARTKCINTCKAMATGSSTQGLSGSGVAVITIILTVWQMRMLMGSSEGACPRSHTQETEKTGCKPSLSSQRTRSLNIHLLCYFPRATCSGIMRPLRAGACFQPPSRCCASPFSALVMKFR